MTSKTILVTGGAGYIGSHVCKVLAKKGFVPVTYDNLYSGNISAVKWGPFEEGDVRDRNRLRAVLKKYQPAAVVHLAALIQIGDSVRNPSEYYDNNFFGTFCVLEEMRACDIQHLVFSSTAAVYGLPQTASISEDHPLNPINPYGSTKLAIENLIHDYTSAYGLRHAILRYFNAAGADPETETGSAYKTETHIIPLLMQVASGIRPDISLFGTDYATPDGTAMRDYVHVSDLADAHVRAIELIMREDRCVTLNLGTNKGYTVQEIIEAARDITGHPIPVRQGERRAGDPDALVADASLARDVLGWEPVHSDITQILSTAWNWRQKQNLPAASNDDTPPPLKAVQSALKSLMDRSAALVALILLAPVFAVVAAALKMEGQGGSVFYGGLRVGRDGKMFKCWKFRSMEPGTDHLLQAYLERHPEAREQWEKYRKLPNDPRVKTRTARLIRKLSIDELPQLWNVLRGEMSLVGPRPILEDEKHYFGDSLGVYCSVRPGVTGLWQVSGRSEATFAQRVGFDVEYVSTWSLAQDISIMVKTVGVLLDRKGAY